MKFILAGYATGDTGELGAAGEKEAAPGQDAIHLLPSEYLARKHQRRGSYNTSMCLSQMPLTNTSEREFSTKAVMLPISKDNRRLRASERDVKLTHTQIGNNNTSDNNNKWSHEQQISIFDSSNLSSSSSSSSSVAIAAHMQQRQELYRHRQRQQPVSSSINLILSILIGISLAAIHTSALTGGSQLGGSTADSTGGGQQQQQQQQHSTVVVGSVNVANSNNANANSASVSTGGAIAESETASGGRSYLQPPPVTTKPQSVINLDHLQPTTINLIPIDQPVVNSGNSLTGGGGLSGLVAPSSGAQANNNFGPPKADSYDGSSINLRTTMPNLSQESTPATQTDDLANSQFAQQPQQQQQQTSDDDFTEPIAQFYTSDNLADAAYQTIVEQPQQSIQQQQQHQEKQLDQLAQIKQVTTSGPLLVTPRQSVERRFGLFKKGHNHFGLGQQQQQQQHQQHYGLPSMSANYASGPYLSDCERCIASFGQQQTAELQQLDPSGSLPLAPPPQPPPPPPPPPSVLPAITSLGGHYPMQPFAPLKNKFFMKFPFLVKPSPFGGGGGGGGGGAGTIDTGNGQHSYWPMAPLGSLYQPGYLQTNQHHHQSSLRPSGSGSGSGMSQALFIRPAPAYNCIQASGPAPSPLLQAAASSYTSSQAEIGSSKTSPVASGKQQHYGAHHHLHHHQQQQQQQQVQGYASKK